VRGKNPRDVWRNYEPKRMNEMPYRRPEGDPRADEIAELVREIAANRRALLQYRSVVRELGRIVKDPWKAGPLAVDRLAFLGTLSAKDTISVRLDPEIAVEGTPSGRLHRIDEQTLIVRRGREQTGRVVGPALRIDLLVEIIGNRSADDVLSIVLPKDLARFEAKISKTLAEVERLLAEGREKVERVERLVCALYGLSDELTEAVVAHAVERAGR
jgi:hypothetical protein